MKSLLQLALLLCCSISVSYSQLAITEMVRSSDNTNLTHEKFEIELIIANANYDNPYDETQIDVEVTFTDITTGQQISVDAFWYQEYRRCADCSTLPDVGTRCKYDDTAVEPDYMTAQPTPRPWRARIAPPTAGTWTYTATVKSDGETASSEVQTVVFSESEKKGIIKVAANNRSFEYADGSSYFPLGMNIVHYGKEDVHSRILYNTVKESMTTLATHSSNLARLWMCPRRFGIEWDDTGLGTYDNRQGRMQDFDDILDHAAATGVKLLLTMDAAYQMEDRWDKNPYKQLVGPDGDQDDFFTNAACRQYYKQKLRYTLSRWGYSTDIFAIELINEVDFYHRSNYYQNHEEIREWHEEMITYMKARDQHPHLYTTSTGYPTAGDFGGSSSRLMSSPMIDFAQLHHYESNMNVEHYRSYLLQRQLELHDKPVLMGEYGNSLNCYHRTQNYTDLKAHKSNEMHNSLWSMAMSGTGGTGLYWWSDAVFNPCWGGGYQYFKPLSIMLQASGMLGYDNTPIANTCSCGGVKDTSPVRKSPDNTDCHPLNTTKEKSPTKKFVLDGIRTSYDCKLSAFAVQTEIGYMGWVHNKDSYWYNLPHNADPYPGVNADCDDLDDNQPSKPSAIETIDRQILLIEDVSATGTCTIEYYSTYSDYDTDGDGQPDDGGVIPQFTQSDVPITNGRIIVKLPILTALGKAPYAPDYGFVIRYNSIEP